MITPSYAVTATERVLPRMALDFTTGVLDPRVTVTRALNTATRINSSGLVEVVNANLPRFDYDPVTLAPKGLLIEESRTNLAFQSADFTTGFWTKTNVTLATGIDDPAGGTSATTLTATAAFGTLQQAVVSMAGTYSASIWIRRRTGTGQISLRCGDLTLIPITVTSSWVRYTVTAVASTTTVRLAVVLTTSGDAVDIWGAQIEAGAFATSYIPTLVGSVTRNADVVTMTGTNFSDWYNSTSGAILARSRQSVITGTRPSIYISDGTANNIISLRGVAANPELYIKATTDQAQIDAGTLTANSSFGLVGAWTADNCAAAINGGAAVTDTSATIPTVDQMLIGSDGTNYLNGQVERISYWPQRIINAEAQAFSK